MPPKKKQQPPRSRMIRMRDSMQSYEHAVEVSPNLPAEELRPGLIRNDYHTAVWQQPEPWRSRDGSIITQVIRAGMTIKYDQTGNWGISYITDCMVTQERWWYGFSALDAGGTQLNVTVYHPWKTAGRGTTYIDFNGRSTDIAAHFAQIANWNRFGDGTFDR